MPFNNYGTKYTGFDVLSHSTNAKNRVNEELLSDNNLLKQAQFNAVVSL
jgi:hypothetical protein